MQILQAHLDNCESYLLAISAVPSISGHSLHKGSPREAFIKEFLADHLPTDLAIGTGELIDHRTETGGQRNQHDIVVYEQSFPRIYLGGGINAYLRESVVATIEVKSSLDSEALKKTMNAAKNTRELQQTGTLNMRPIGNYIVAYSGPTKMDTVFGWIAESYKTLHLVDPELGPSGLSDRRFIPSPALDGVYLLGVGACIFENNVGFSQHPNVLPHQNAAWSIVDCQRGALFLLFAGMLGLIQEDYPRTINPYLYMTSFSAPSIRAARIDASGPLIFPEAKTDPT
jgi:hypothetical protein